jgi:hypothetical protein
MIVAECYQNAYHIEQRFTPYRPLGVGSMYHHQQQQAYLLVTVSKANHLEHTQLGGGRSVCCQHEHEPYHVVASGSGSTQHAPASTQTARRTCSRCCPSAPPPPPPLPAGTGSPAWLPSHAPSASGKQNSPWKPTVLTYFAVRSSKCIVSYVMGKTRILFS